ncbi:MAG: DUF1294 domain-containing protein [Lachnospiraceae bacterium]|nr:DUF1294 domain-containing protein [Lachnospiraceae bacterium]MBF0999414.1 DUF1294 domain-containing protein [Lachnospiraceae bacterium]MBF1009370.1 DUF1294 domain-containing protein [Lachnospiraceae bacterium]MBF1012330.1 DUF1294 domain-containing protein [Lachnospiraceae bacterium]MBF1030175.1 DUF1294 domain-containing protein [Lachnospiraceae bacterium]
MRALTLITVYLIIVNLAAFLLMGVDKQKARHHAWRISESTLFTAALIGGSIGSILGMQIFRHKTRHPAFVIGMPLILLVQLAFVVLLWRLPVPVLFL